MATHHRFNLAKALVVLIEALLVSFALLYLAEFAASPLVREAGGSVL
jgi:hypothetical protein